MTIVELRQIYYVIEVAKWNSFTKAAEVINITQPSLSQQISKLEKEYNIKIFDRTTRFVVPTDLGERFIEDAKLLINAVEGFNNKVMTRQHQINGTFRIGVERVIGYLNLYSLISAFQEKFPDVVITIIEGDTKNLILDMVNSVIDAAIYTQPIENERNSLVDDETLTEDEMVLIVSKKHRLAQKKFINMTDLREERIILPDKNTGASSIIFDIFNRANIKPNKVGECSQVNIVLELVQNQVGVTFFSSAVAKVCVGDEMAIIPMARSEVIKKFTVLSALKRNRLQPITQAFREFAIDWIIQRDDLPHGEIPHDNEAFKPISSSSGHSLA